jgi:hypothetical protein
MGAPQQGVAAGRHCGARALPGSSLATKRQREIAERRIQTECALRGGGEKGRQALTEGGGWTGRNQAAKATQLEQEKRRLTADGQVIRPTRVIAMHPGRDSTAMRACGTRGRDKCCENQAHRRTLNLRDGHIGDEFGKEGHASMVGNKCTHPSSIADTSGVCLSTGDAEEPIIREAMRRSNCCSLLEIQPTAALS